MAEKKPLGLPPKSDQIKAGHVLSVWKISALLFQTQSIVHSDLPDSTGSDKAFVLREVP